jgi:hypothetical protein
VKSKILCLVTTLLILSSCSIVKKIAGADVDAEQFEKARMAKMLEVRVKSSEKLLDRLNQAEPIDKTDIQFTLSKDFLNKIVKQYEHSTGWLDAETSYKIETINLNLKNGVILVNLGLIANNSKYSADVKLNMDCILALNSKNNEIVGELEPFNISPNVEIKSILSSASEIVENLIKINLGNLSNSFPPLKIPVDFSNSFAIPGSINNIKSAVNLNITNVKRQIDYSLKLKEILIFENGVLISLNIDKLEVK